MLRFLIPLTTSLICWIDLSQFNLTLAADVEARHESVNRYEMEIRPLLESRCFECHANGNREGGISLDAPDLQALLSDQKLWHQALRMVRADMMPPDGDHLNESDKALLANWVKRDILGLEEQSPDPGSVTVRRLNRVEYQNTIRDLLGVRFKVEESFPIDDSGHGFDNISNVQTLSPILLEKYIAAASNIVDEVVPKIRWSTPRIPIALKSFEFNEGSSAKIQDDQIRFSYYGKSTASTSYKLERAGYYQVEVKLALNERFVDNVFDYNKCKVSFSLDGEVLWSDEFARDEGRSVQLSLDRQLEVGDHSINFQVEPLTSEEQVRDLKVIVQSVDLVGPSGDEYRVHPAGYKAFFHEDVPENTVDQVAYATSLLKPIVTKAFRRPVDESYMKRLVDFAISNSQLPNESFESGVASALVAVLSSPLFLFMEQTAEVSKANLESEPREKIRDFSIAAVDDYTLASRLSYFIWSSMPDEELMNLASKNELHANLIQQVNRMLADEKANAFTENFVGQWLRSRDIESANVNASATLARDAEPDPEADLARERFRELRRKNNEELTAEEKAELEAMRNKFIGSFRRFRDFELNGELRRSMRRETEMLFDFIVDENRNLLELIDADYTFLNERLAKHYKIEGVEGREMRRVELPDNSTRGGILTQGTFLVVTSNPDRTSPVKRGLFVLENLLGTPPPPPPPNIPGLEDSLGGRDPKSLTLRETLEIHRQDAGCAGCHNRMDPIGLGLENFNALGMWRDKERKDTIMPEGTLITGESFESIQQLKSILKTNRKEQFFRTATEKMLTYALGRGLEFYDVDTIDKIVDRLQQNDGAARELVYGIVTSPAFTHTRISDPDS